MTAFIQSIVSPLILLLAGSYFIFWALDNIKSETLKTGAIIAYGIFFITLTSKIIIEVFKMSY